MKKNDTQTNRKKLYGLIFICAFVTAMLLMVLFVGIPMIRFVSEPEKFRIWIESHGSLGRLAYMGMVMLQVIVCVIPGEPIEIAAGYAFGAVEGTLLCLTASALASIAVFALVRKYGTRLVECFFPIEKLHSLRFLKESPKRDALFLFIFMLPGTPKDLLCFFAGLTEMPFTVFLIAGSLGRIPSIITSTVGGDALGTKNYLFAVIVFAITLVISLLGIYIYQQICKKHSDRKKRITTNREEADKDN